MSTNSPLFFDRYELKYLIPFELIEPISQYASQFCRMDPYSERSHDGFYTINNLYLDTPNYQFFERRLQKDANRFNMRIRSYGEDPKPPYFVEVKMKNRNFVKKRRAKVFDENIGEMISSSDFEPSVKGNDKEESNRLKFLRLAYTYNVEPKVFTQYRRKAYLSLMDEYARVTFDRDLRYQFRNEYKFTPDDDRMSHYDNETLFDDGCNIILELKCTSFVPLWMLDLIKKFNLTRSRFSKYASGVTEVLRAESTYRRPHHAAFY